jgi:acyl-CoA thioesterase YciA
MNDIITRYSQLVMPQDANVVGTLFGGQMVSWMDIAAAKSVHRFLKETKVDSALTRAIDAIEFKEPVYVGNWVNFESKIINTGNSSIVIQVEAFKESNKDNPLLACKARFTMVSVKKDKSGLFKKINHNKSIG